MWRRRDIICIQVFNMKIFLFRCCSTFLAFCKLQNYFVNLHENFV